MRKEFLEIGKIVGTHGVRGMVRIQPWCDGVAFLKGVKNYFTDENGKNFLNCEKIAENGNVFIAKFSGIETIEQAETYRGKILYINRNDVKLQKGSYFIQDIIDCAVFDAETGEEYGTVSDVSQTGANDVWHIKRNEKEYLIPVIPPVVKDVDVDNGVIKIIALKGIFDDED